LLRDILKRPEVTSALVFSRTKHGANKISQALIEGGIYAEAIHGNKSQSARTEALRKFKEKKMKVLVATDIAARGLDIDHLSHVINYDLPEVPETYIHRIGRTGRAGLDGIAISFCGEEEYGLLIDIEYHIGQKIKVELNHPYNIKPSLQKPQPKPQNQQRRR
jgi:ATP-dependent RNA helicase RhlE